MKCKQCSHQIFEGDAIKCCTCTHAYHFSCVGMKESNFRKMGSKRDTWVCSNCKEEPRNDPGISANPLEQRFAVLQTKILEELNSTVKSLIQSEFAQLREEIRSLQSLRESVSHMNAQYEELRGQLGPKIKEIDNLRQENSQLQETVKDLSARLAIVEQRSRDCNLELQCVPEHKAENLVMTVQQLAKIVSCPIADNDIMACTRVAKVNKDSTRPRSIICTLSSPRKRDSLLAACIKFNKSQAQQKSDKLNTSHLGIGGDKHTPVYVAEHLSPTNRTLHVQARKFKKDSQFQYLWVRNGRILLRKNITSPAIWVKNIDTLSKLRREMDSSSPLENAK